MAMVTLLKLNNIYYSWLCIIALYPAKERPGNKDIEEEGEREEGKWRGRGGEKGRRGGGGEEGKRGERRWEEGRKRERRGEGGREGGVIVGIYPVIESIG